MIKKKQFRSLVFLENGNKKIRLESSKVFPTKKAALKESEKRLGEIQSLTTKQRIKKFGLIKSASSGFNVQ